MQSRVITTYDEFLKLKAPWQELHELAGGCLFQLHDWLSVWWKVYGASRGLSIYTFWNDALLVGVVPCFKEDKQFGPVSFRRLSFLGEEEAYGEYYPLVESGSIEAVARSAASSCVKELKCGEVEIVDFHGFPPDSPFMERFIEWFGVGGAQIRYIPQSQPHFVFEGARSGEEFAQLISYRRRRNLRRQLKRLSEAGAEIEVVTQWDGGKPFDDLVRLHTTRWAHIGQPGRFGSPRFTEFLRTVTERLLPDGLARLYFMRYRDERICGLLSFRAHCRHYSYLIGRDPIHELTRWSIGEVLSMQETMDAFDDGMVSCDLMGGDYQHKQYTGITRRWYARATAIAPGRRGTKGYLYWGALAMRDALARVKRMRARLSDTDDHGESKSS